MIEGLVGRFVRLPSDRPAANVGRKVALIFAMLLSYLGHPDAATQASHLMLAPDAQRSIHDYSCDKCEPAALFQRQASTREQMNDYKHNNAVQPSKHVPPN